VVVDSIERLIDICKVRNREIYIWGVGFYGEMIGFIFDNLKIGWSGYYDNYVSSDKSIGKPIKSAKDIDVNGFFVLSMGEYSEVYKQLIDLGVADENIACLSKRTFEEVEERNGYTKEMEKRMLELRDKYQGQYCFIVGNGPSLRITDLEKIKDSGIKSFGCNGAWSAFDKTKWRPDFYFISDIFAIRNYVDDENVLKLIQKECENVFLRCGLNTKKLFGDNVYLFNQIYSRDSNGISFSNECEKRVYIGYTVTYIMLQMAIFMGFSPIYLLGVDHSYSTELNNGKVEKKECEDHASFLKEGKDIYDIYRTTNAYVSAKKYADAHGIDIRNATRGGKLEVFPRADFESLFIGNREEQRGK